MLIDFPHCWLTKQEKKRETQERERKKRTRFDPINVLMWRLNKNDSVSDSHTKRQCSLRDDASNSTRKNLYYILKEIEETELFSHLFY